MSAPVSVAGSLRIGVAGLGRAFTLMLPTFVADSRVRLVGAADLQADARARFTDDFAAPAVETVEALCALPQVDIVYVATPHRCHAEHVRIAAAAGKHLLVEKPMAITLTECDQMIDAACAAGVKLIVGPSHSFDAPMLRTRGLIDSGRFGRVRMITAMNYTDFLYRPRRPEELDTALGGGVVHSQAAHQIDILRLLAGGLARTVVAHTGAWDQARPTEGAYQALISFEDGASAVATYSGYAHFDSDTLVGGTGELGNRKDPARHGLARQRLRDAAARGEQEAASKRARNYGAPGWVRPAMPGFHEHFGHLVVSCEGADLLPTPTGVAIHADDSTWIEPIAAPVVPRREVIDELEAVVLEGSAPVHGGEWARATTEVCLAILESARTGKVCTMRRQVGLSGSTASGAAGSGAAGSGAAGSGAAGSGAAGSGAAGSGAAVPARPVG